MLISATIGPSRGIHSLTFRCYLTLAKPSIVSVQVKPRRPVNVNQILTSTGSFYHDLRTEQQAAISKLDVSLSETTMNVQIKCDFSQLRETITIITIWYCKGDQESTIIQHYWRQNHDLFRTNSFRCIKIIFRNFLTKNFIVICCEKIDFN